jgi:membrane protease YdiL (CAAX protease family)
MKHITYALAVIVWLLGFVVLRQTGSTLALQVGAVSLATWLMFKDTETRALLAWRTGPFLVGLLAGVAMIVSTYVLYPIALRYLPHLRTQVIDLETLLFEHKSRMAVLGVVLPTSVCEEILFRGRVLDSTKQRRGLSVALAAIIYAAAHITSGSAALVFVAFACGVAWGWLRRTTGSLWSSIACHVAWDLAIMVFKPLQ